MTSLHDIPQELVGHLYSLLPDRDNRRAFYASTKAVCTAPSVLHQLSKLTVPKALLQALLYAFHPFLNFNPLLTFPRKATLRHLVIQYSYPEQIMTFMAMLNPQLPEQRTEVLSRLQGLEELELQGDKPLTHETSALGAFLCTHAPMLSRLKVPAGCDASLLHALPPRQLKELHITQKVDADHLAAIQYFTNLQVLHIGLSHEHRLVQVLSKLPGLKECSMCLRGFIQDEMDALPPSIEKLGMGSATITRLTTLLQKVARGELPACMCIHVGCLFSWTDVPAETLVDQSHLALAVAATPHIEHLLDTYSIRAKPEVNGRFNAQIWGPLQLFPSVRNITFRSTSQISNADLAEVTRLCPQLKGIRFDECDFDIEGLSSWLSEMTQLEILQVYPNDHDIYEVGMRLIDIGVDAATQEREHSLCIEVGGGLMPWMGVFSLAALMEDDETAALMENKAIETQLAQLEDAWEQAMPPDFYQSKVSFKTNFSSKLHQFSV